MKRRDLKGKRLKKYLIYEEVYSNNYKKRVTSRKRNMTTRPPLVRISFTPFLPSLLSHQFLYSIH